MSLEDRPEEFSCGGLAAQLEILAHALARGVADAIASLEAPADDGAPTDATGAESSPKGSRPSSR